MKTKTTNVLAEIPEAEGGSPEPDDSTTTVVTRRPGVSTPWGPTVLLEEARVDQSVGEKSFATLVQLLEADNGEQLVRVAYSTGGVARRGPVTLRPQDIDELRSVLAVRPALTALLGLEANGSA